MAVVNADYEFILVNIGDYGRLSDGGVLANSEIGYSILNELFDLPPPRMLEGTNTIFPYVFVGDDAFPLKTNLIKPYSRSSNFNQRNAMANYRISRARRVVENAFGIATFRFRIFSRSITVSVKTATEVTKAVVALHNYLIREGKASSNNSYSTGDFNTDFDVPERPAETAYPVILDINDFGATNNYS